MKIKRIKTLSEAKKLLASGKQIYCEALTYQNGMEVNSVKEWPDHKIGSIFNARKDIDFRSLLFSTSKQLQKDQFFKVVKALIDNYTDGSNDKNSILLKAYMFPETSLPKSLFEHGLLLKQAYPSCTKENVISFIDTGIPSAEELEDIIDSRKQAKTAKDKNSNNGKSHYYFKDLIKANHGKIYTTILRGHNIRYVKQSDKNNDPLVQQIEQLICDYDNQDVEGICDEMKTWYNGIKKSALSTLDIILHLPDFGNRIFAGNKTLQYNYGYTPTSRGRR